MKNTTGTPTKIELIKNLQSKGITKHQLRFAISTLMMKISNDEILNLTSQNDIDNLNMLLEIQKEYFQID